MAAKPLTSEAIALTEKKMDMALDDIIKMSKNTGYKSKQQRTPNKSKKFLNGVTQEKTSKVRRFMDSRSSLRQGVLAHRRSSNFQRNQFPLATEVARNAAVAPLRNRAINRNRVANWNKSRVGAPPVKHRDTNGGFVAKQQQSPLPQGNVVPKQKPKTLDCLFANMKEQRMKALSRQNVAVQNNTAQRRHGGGGGGPQRPPWARGRFGH